MNITPIFAKLKKLYLPKNLCLRGSKLDVNIDLKKIRQAGLVIVMACHVSLAACSYINHQVDPNPPSQRQQQCAAINNQLNLQQETAGVSSAPPLNAAQEASAMRLHDRYDCGKFEKNSKQTR